MLSTMPLEAGTLSRAIRRYKGRLHVDDEAVSAASNHSKGDIFPSREHAVNNFLPDNNVMHEILRLSNFSSSHTGLFGQQ